MSGIDARFAGRFGAFRLDVAFAAPERGVTALFGPSACGKTTVLRCLAGLARPADGRLQVNGAVWQDAQVFVPAHRRAVGYVFQEASLFPHLSVRDNLRFGLRRARRQGAAGDAPTAVGFDDVVALLGLAPLIARGTARLSGGERQRVAIGRALLSRPQLLLMDEPLSALDRFTKDEIIPYLEGLHAALAIPVIYVSHDLAEVERLADRIVLLAEGRVVAAGPLAEIATRLDLPLAHAAAAAAVFDGVVEGYDRAYRLASVRVDGATLLVPSQPASVGSRRRLRIVAADVSLAVERAARSTILNVLPARIERASPAGEAQMRVVLRLGEGGDGGRLLATITRRSWDTLALHPGLAVFAQLKSISLVDDGAGGARSDGDRRPGPSGRR
jgi:molybdate transport system ATP-binding protein